jgi:lysophospholipid hydrolase
MGGGGARGLAHLGVIRALNEVGVPVDMVGGTSQGAFVGALLARNPDDFGLLTDSVREMAADMSSISNKLRDLTFPLTSFFSGHHFNRGIKKILGDARIQDFVLNFFCVSVDICNACQMVHTQGLAWKYVRASMSLTGYLPPISENNRLLVDGGYMNVVPADVMADNMGARRIIAVDVALEEKNDYYEYGTELSGLWLLWNSWNPFVQTVKVPSMGDINERLAWVSSERSKKDIVKNKVDLFLRPPVGHIGTLEYDKIDEIAKIGYEYAKPLVEEWAKENGFVTSQR